MSDKKFIVVLVAISLSIFALDMYSKWAILQMFEYMPYFKTGESVSVWGNFFKLTYVQNYGITFGMLNNLDKNYMLAVLTVTSSLALGVLVYFYTNIQKILKPQGIPAGKIALAMIFGGALGNIIDRIMRGFVVDFLDFGTATYRWYTFNVADVFIVSGCILLGLMMILFEIKEDHQKPQE